ncbi:MAG: type II toxin-antitoxin system RelE/ParE family toxin [Gallionella sp.]|nr:type II toxin-antitoxin system RelE/ParE family toxin [Gallionella sp.]MDD4958630.1 type II toxin-antitoxin system RelE/ParE family toxin [Gallionella sp.]
MTYSLHPRAEQDVADALDFYSEHAGTVVAERFIEEFERVAKLVVEHPNIGTPTTSGRRAFPLRIFPYSVVYRNLESSILILIVRHQHRKPRR